MDVKVFYLQEGWEMSKVERRAVHKMFIMLGSITVAVLIIVGGLAWYGYKFITDNVRSELVAQKIYFPAKGSSSLSPEEFPDLQQYAGQLVDDGEKAKAYADGFIGRHLTKIADGKTYSEVSAEALADPSNTVLQKQVELLFRGTTLRSMLLGNAYAFWTMGLISKYVSITAFIGAALVFVATTLCMKRMRKI